VPAYTFFGVQIAIQAGSGDPLRARLHEAVARAPGEQSLNEKRQFWKRICAALAGAEGGFRYGFWDLIRTEKAEEEFETWCAEIEGSVASEADDPVARAAGPRDHALFTLLFLLERGSNSDLTLGERCDLPESQYFTRDTFARLVASPPLLNFANVKADAVYLVPGNDEDGLTAEELRGDGYDYLKPLT
jgi:hypothetical protein